MAKQMNTLCCWWDLQPRCGGKCSAASWGKEQCRFPSWASANSSSLSLEELCFYSLLKGSDGCYNLACSLLDDTLCCHDLDDHNQLKDSMGCCYGLYIH